MCDTIGRSIVEVRQHQNDYHPKGRGNEKVDLYLVYPDGNIGRCQTRLDGLFLKNKNRSYNQENTKKN